jgi:hypothetical protein
MTKLWSSRVADPIYHHGIICAKFESVYHQLSFFIAGSLQKKLFRCFILAACSPGLKLHCPWDLHLWNLNSAHHNNESCHAVKGIRSRKEVFFYIMFFVPLLYLKDSK